MSRVTHSEPGLPMVQVIEQMMLTSAEDKTEDKIFQC